MFAEELEMSENIAIIFHHVIFPGEPHIHAAIVKVKHLELLTMINRKKTHYRDSILKEGPARARVMTAVSAGFCMCVYVGLYMLACD